MSIDGVSGKTSYIGTSIINMRSQLNDLTTQLATGKISTTYAGQGTDRGFALSLRAQVSSIDAFADTANNVNTRLNVANLALQGLTDIGTPGQEGLDHGDPRAQQQRPDLRPDHGAGGVRQRGRRFSTASPATAICFPAAPLIRRRPSPPTSCSTAPRRRRGSPN